jgi:hypothetical protein
VALIRWILLTILVLVVLRLVRFALAPARARRPASSRGPGRPPDAPERLVQDPVCGLVLPESRALRDGDAFYCSPECRRVSRER